MAQPENKKTKFPHPTYAAGQSDLQIPFAVTAWAANTRYVRCMETCSLPTRHEPGYSRERSKSQAVIFADRRIQISGVTITASAHCQI